MGRQLGKLHPEEGRGNHGSVRTLADPLATAESVEQYGNYRAALNNVAAWRDRFIPLRRRSPEALFYLKQRNIYPEMIYIDVYKEEEDLRVADELFPDAILCGDDWDWRDEDGELVMQLNVQRFAADYGFRIEAEGATWILARTGPACRQAVEPAARRVTPRCGTSSGTPKSVRRGIASMMFTRFAAVIDRPELRDAAVLMVGCDAASVEAAIGSPVERYVGTNADGALIEQLRKNVDDDRFAFHHFDPATTGEGLPIGDETLRPDRRGLDLRSPRSRAVPGTAESVATARGPEHAACLHRPPRRTDPRWSRCPGCLRPVAG